jgi:hypothetical protein
VHTVFDLLGEKENDLTYALGWGLANSPRLIEAVRENVGAELALKDTGDHPGVRLQEYVPDSGYTDVEIRSDKAHVIIEAKRGWVLPDEYQLGKYAESPTPWLAGAMVIIAEGSPAFASGKYPTEVPGPDGPVPVLYRSWEQATLLAEGVSGGASNEARLAS